jgi:hypothetical protein
MKYMKIILLSLSVFHLFSLFYPCQVLSDGYEVPSINRTNKKAQFIPPFWEEAVTKIRVTTKIPILVPREIPRLEDIRLGNGRQMFGYSDGNTNKYTLAIRRFKECGPRNCILFEMDGEVITEKTEVWEKTYQYMLDISEGHASYCKKNPYPPCSEVILARKDLLNQVAPITLVNGIKGIFLPRYCFATGCLPAQIVWKNDIYQYRVRLHGSYQSPLKELVRIANSAIENQP